MNYDPSSPVGVPYVRAHRITIEWPDKGQSPSFLVQQSLAVKLADESIRQLDVLPDIIGVLDFATKGSDPVPLVSPDTGAPLGADTTLNQAFVAVLAIVRQAQLAANPE